MEIIASGDIEGIRRYQCDGAVYFQARDLIARTLGDEKPNYTLQTLYSEVGAGLIKCPRGSWLIAEAHVTAFANFICSPDNQRRARGIFFGAITKGKRMTSTKTAPVVTPETELRQQGRSTGPGYYKERLPGIEWDFTFMLVAGRRFVLCADVEEYLTGRRGSKYYSGLSKVGLSDKTRGPGPGGPVCNYIALDKAAVPFLRMSSVAGGPKLNALMTSIASVPPLVGQPDTVTEPASVVSAKADEVKSKGLQLFDAVSRIEEAMVQMAARIENLTRTVDVLQACNADLTAKLTSQAEDANRTIGQLTAKLAAQAEETNRMIDQLARASHPPRRGLFGILRAA